MKELHSNFNIKKNIIWAVLSLFIAAASIYTVVKINKDFSLEHVLELINNASLPWVAAAFAAMFLYIIFGGMAVRTLVHSFGFKCSRSNSFIYSAADIYVSAITPSSTGGQPASAYFMIKDGIPASCATLSLVFTLAMHTIAKLILGVMAIILKPSAFLFFDIWARVFIIIGLIFLVFASMAFLSVVFKSSWIDAIGRLAIGTAYKLRLIRDREKWLGKFNDWLLEYNGYAAIIRGKTKYMTRALVFNIAKRLCQLMIIPLTYIAINVKAAGGLGYTMLKDAFSLLTTQSLVSVGASLVPIPGAMGLTDLMMLSGFSAVMASHDAAGLELLSRAISFYFPVMICFFVTLGALLFKRKKTKQELPQQL